MKEDLAGVLCKFLALSMPSPSSGPKARSRKLVSSEFSHSWVTFHASLHFLTKVVMNFCGHCCSSLPKLQVSSWELTCITEVASFGILLALKYPRRRNSSQTFWCFSKKKHAYPVSFTGRKFSFLLLAKGIQQFADEPPGFGFLGKLKLDALSCPHQGGILTNEDLSNISSIFFYHFAEWLEVLLAKVLVFKQKVYAHLL